MADPTKTPGSATGSGSDTVSAARLAGGAPGAAPQSAASHGTTPATGNPAQSGTLASHTSAPLGGTAGSGAGAGTHSAQSRGPEHNLHQDSTAGRSGTSHGTSSGGASTADTVRHAASQAQDRAGEYLNQASDWASEQAERGSRQFSDMRRRGARSASSAQDTVERFIHENPVLVGIVGLAAGLLVGALLPRTGREDRTFGAWSDEVRDQGLRYARDMTQRGRDYVEEAFSDDEDEGPRHGQPQRSEPPRGPRPGPSGRYQNH